MSGSNSIETATHPLHFAPARAERPREHERSATAPRSLAAVDATSDARVAEVVIAYGDAVLGVFHLGQRRARAGRRALGLLAAGTALFVGGVGLFAYESQQDWGRWADETRTAAESGLAAPAKPGLGTGPLGLALALFGLVPCLAGGTRLRERKGGDFTIGESPEASFQVPGDGLPVADAFPLVRTVGDELVVAFGEGLHGSLIERGRARAFAELADSHATRRTELGAHSLVVPRGARAVVHHGELTFHVAPVAADATKVARGELDGRFWAYVGGTGLACASLWMLARSVPAVGAAIAIDDDAGESRFARYMFQAAVEEELPPALAPRELERGASGGQGQRARGTEGAAGKPTSTQRDRSYAMKGPKDATAMMSRHFDPDLNARSAGILGIMEEHSGHFLSHPDGGVFAVGNDDEDLWGNLTGREVGEAYGVGGLGLVGSGHSGGGDGAGTIGLGNLGTIGHNAGGGTSLGYGKDSGAGFGARRPKQATVRAGAVTNLHGAIDKDTVRRIVRAHINEVRGCYNSGLAGDPTLAGRVSIQFVILPSGRVGSAVVQESSLKDADVANCIAKAVTRWSFPRPLDGGNVIVSYPFQLRAA